MPSSSQEAMREVKAQARTAWSSLPWNSQLALPLTTFLKALSEALLLNGIGPGLTVTPVRRAFALLGSGAEQHCAW